MDLIAGYGDDASGSEKEEEVTVPIKPSITVSSAPEVNTTGIVLFDGQAQHAGAIRHLQDPSTRQIMHNLPYEDLHAPVMGPAHPFNKDGIAQGLKNHRAGYVEDTHMHDYHFDEQYNTFHSKGYAAAPSGAGVVLNTKGNEFEQGDGESIFSSTFKRRKTTTEKKEEAARKLEERSRPFDPNEPFSLEVRQPWANKEAEVTELTEEQKEYLAKTQASKEEQAADDVEKKGPVSFFHGKEKQDYQGRSWVDAPKDKRKENEQCFLPKRWIHTWSGHTKGVNAIRFFPNTGHLLLSAGLDGKVKIWDVYNTMKCMRTYLGHSKGVRDITFTNDGRRFVSTGYDRNIRLWDTETGTCIRTFNTGKIYYCVKLHPDKQNVLMAGCQDKKIYQFDMDTGDVVQEYNYHLGPVNTITFIDDGNRFVTTSDDKTIRVWEFGIPVQIKYIADPSMHSMPAVAMNSKGTYMLAQSLDNQVLTYSTKDKFRQNKQKTFKGHNTAGYACQVNFSPDQRYVMSGDSEGRCFFWEWSHPYKIVRTIKAHDAVCIGCEWHPLESSKVATCGWDGLIKYWD